MGKKVAFHATPFVVLIAFLVAFTLFFYIPAGQSAPTLSFFGVYAGTYSVYGIHLEHEFVGVGLLIALALSAPLMRTNRVWSVSLALIGAFLVLSDITSIVAGNLFTNTTGVEASVIIGALTGVLAGGIITGGKGKGG